MNRKLSVFGLAFIFLAFFAVPLVSATKPVTMTLTGTYYVLGMGDSYMVEAGESGITLWRWLNMPMLWIGDISGSGVNNGNSLIKEGPFADVGVGTFFLEDVTIDGVGTGDLTIGTYKDGLQCFIKSGSDDLRSIRGKGTATPVSMIEYDYEFEVQINP